MGDITDLSMHSACLYQPGIPALQRQPALLRMYSHDSFASVPRDFAGTMECKGHYSEGVTQVIFTVLRQAADVHTNGGQNAQQMYIPIQDAFCTKTICTAGTRWECTQCFPTSLREELRTPPAPDLENHTGVCDGKVYKVVVRKPSKVTI